MALPESLPTPFRVGCSWACPLVPASCHLQPQPLSTLVQLLVSLMTWKATRVADGNGCDTGHQYFIRNARASMAGRLR